LPSELRLQPSALSLWPPRHYLPPLRPNLKRQVKALLKKFEEAPAPPAPMPPAEIKSAPVAVLPAPVATPPVLENKVTLEKEVPAENPKNLTIKGRIVSNLDVDVKCKVSGQILRLPVDIGDVVKKGQILAELDTTDEQRAVQRAQLTVKSSQMRLEQSKQSLNIAEQSLTISKGRLDAVLLTHEVKARRCNDRLSRLKDPAKREFISKEEYDDAEAEAIIAGAQLESMRAQHADLKTQQMALKLKKHDIELAETQLEMDKLNLSNAQQRLTDTSVLAPIGGVISYRYVQTGNVIISGTSTQGTRLCTISDLSQLFVIAPVEPVLLGQIVAGAKVKIICDAYPDNTFHGRVARIAPRGIAASTGVMFEVKIEILDENRDLLKPDMPAKVVLDLNEKDS
jgi:HlyD family secretion protein